jgi:PKD domain
MGGKSIANQSESEYLGSKKLLSIGLVIVVLASSLAIALPSMAALLVRTEGVPTGLDFAYTPSDPNTGSVVAFTGIASDPDGDQLTFSWDFGDGYSATGETVSHQFMNGTSNVTMFVDDGETGPEPRPLTLTKEVIVTQNSPPTISVPDNPFVCVRAITNYTVGFSDDDADDVHLFTWFWGDGQSIVSSVSYAEHVYAAKGVKNMTVFCDDLTGLPGHNVSDFGINTVVSGCMNRAPVISVPLAASSNWVLVHEAVDFWCTATDYDQDLLGFTFEFGDGTFAYENLTSPATASASHAYDSPGFYDVYVAITDYKTLPISSGPVTIEVMGSPVSLSLSQGWNWVGIPLVGSDYRASNIGLQLGDVVVGYNQSTRAYDRTYVVGLSPPTLDFSLTPGIAFWIYSGTTKTLQISGYSPVGIQTVPISVPPGGGWVSFVFLGLQTHHANSIPAMFSGGTISTVAIYMPAPYRYYKTYITGLPPTDFVISPGLGVWLFCTGSGLLTYAP